MVTSIQAVSDAGGVAALSPLQLWSGLSRVAQAQIASQTSPSAITTLGVSADTAALTYDTVVLLQTFISSPSLYSGLNAAQQRDLAAVLGLNANATSADVMDAINTLLMPADASQVLVNVLLGDASAATAEANPTIPALYNDQGVIEGVPGDSTSQARDAALATLLDLGATDVVTNTTGTPVSSTDSVSGNPLATSAAAVSENVPTENLVPATTQQAVAANPAGTVAATDATEGFVAAAEPAAELVQTFSAAPATATETAAVVAAAVGAATTSAAAATALTSTEIIAEIAAEIPAAPGPAAGIVIPAAPFVTETTDVTAIATAQVAAATQTLQSLGTTVAEPLPANSPVTVSRVAVAQAAAVPVTAFAGLGVAAEAAVPATAATVAGSTTPIIRFDNAGSVLRSLLADVAAHAMIQRNPASATYSVGGAWFQMATGADRAQQATLKGNLPDLRDVTRPISRVAATRGTLERQR